MPVLVEGISVVMRRKAIDAKFPGAWEGFQRIVPNNTLCFDEELARVGFMSPQDVQALMAELQQQGLTFLEDNKAIDIAVVDQQRGVTAECEWLTFIHLKINESGDKVSVCWLTPEKRVSAAGVTMPTNWRPEGGMRFAPSPGWTYENSLSQKFRFVENGNVDKELILVGYEDGLDVYLDLKTGKKSCEGRTTKE